MFSAIFLRDRTLSVYKNRGPLLSPFTCARAVRAAPTATLSGAEEGSRTIRRPKATPRPEAQRDQEGEVDSPDKTLAGVASAALARSLPGQLA